MRKPRTRFFVESLEDRVVLSQSLPALPIHQLPAHVESHAHLLEGSIQGQYVRLVSIPDTGTLYSFHGQGKIAGLGTVKLSGTLHTPGFTPTGQTTGTLTLQNSKGMIVLQVAGPEQPGFSPLPGSFTYQVTKATGKFTSKTAPGSATLSLGQSASGAETFKITFN